MARRKPRALEELAQIARGDPAGPQHAFVQALEDPELARVHGQLAAGARAGLRPRYLGPFNTGRTQPLPSPPGWLPPGA